MTPPVSEFCDCVRLKVNLKPLWGARIWVHQHTPPDVSPSARERVLPHNTVERQVLQTDLSESGSSGIRIHNFFWYVL